MINATFVIRLAGLPPVLLTFIGRASRRPVPRRALRPERELERVMPATSEKQRRLFGVALSAKRGKTKRASGKAKQLASRLSTKQLEDFARKPAGGY